jgi:hypothetical protein
LFSYRTTARYLLRPPIPPKIIGLFAIKFYPRQRQSGEEAILGPFFRRIGLTKELVTGQEKILPI